MTTGNTVAFICGCDLIVYYKIADCIGAVAVRSLYPIPLIAHTGDQVGKVLRTVKLKISRLLVGTQEKLVIDLHCTTV